MKHKAFCLRWYKKKSKYCTSTGNESLPIFEWQGMFFQSSEVSLEVSRWELVYCRYFSLGPSQKVGMSHVSVIKVPHFRAVIFMSRKGRFLEKSPLAELHLQEVSGRVAPWRNNECRGKSGWGEIPRFYQKEWRRFPSPLIFHRFLSHGQVLEMPLRLQLCDSSGGKRTVAKSCWNNLYTCTHNI